MLAFANLRRSGKGAAKKLPISPLEGEMPGRAEGGAVPPTPRSLAHLRLFALPANGLSDVRSAILIGTPGISKASRRLLER